MHIHNSLEIALIQAVFYQNRNMYYYQILSHTFQDYPKLQNQGVSTLEKNNRYILQKNLSKEY